MNVALAKFMIKANNHPTHPAMIASIQASNLPACVSDGLRWPETIRKKIRKAAISTPAESGNNTRQCHSYTPAIQRRVTPEPHMSNEVQGAQRANGFMRRNFGIE